MDYLSSLFQKAAMAVLWLCAAGVVQAQVPVLRISAENTVDHVQTKAIARFAAQLEQASNGRLKVRFYHGAKLFRDRDVIAALTTGKVDMAVPGMWQLDRYVPDAGLYMLPLFYGRPPEVHYRVRDGAIGREINRRIENNLNVVVPGRWLDLGYAHLYFTEQRISEHKQLTGLINRGRTEQMLAEEIHRYHRYGTSFGLIMLDVDHFKQVNDTCGHEVGDQVLCRLAKLMQEHTRLSDCPGRWGGEEFLILCPNTDLKGVQQLAEALRERIANEDFPVIGQRTCSFGVTVIGPGDNAKALLVRADEALYRAKSGGRNRVEVA